MVAVAMMTLVAMTMALAAMTMASMATMAAMATMALVAMTMASASMMAVEMMMAVAAAGRMSVAIAVRHTGLDIFGLCQHLIPFHVSSGNHWIVISMDVKEQTITCYDPLGTNCPKQVTLVKSFLTDHCSKNGGHVYQLKRVPQPEDGIAHQKNRVSCGVVTVFMPTFIQLEEILH